MHHQDYDRNEVLLVASRDGDYETVRSLLESGVDVNYQEYNNNIKRHPKLPPTPNGFTALIMASASGHDVIVKLLLDAGASVNLCDNDLMTPLMRACKGGHAEVVRMLINAGASIGYDKEKQTALHKVAFAKKQTAHITKLLIDAGVNVNTGNKDGATALMFAAANGHTEMVRLLLQAGANPNIHANGYGTALDGANEFNHQEIIKILKSATNKAEPIPEDILTSNELEKIRGQIYKPTSLMKRFIISYWIVCIPAVIIYKLFINPYDIPLNDNAITFNIIGYCIMMLIITIIWSRRLLTKEIRQAEALKKTGRR